MSDQITLPREVVHDAAEVIRLAFARGGSGSNCRKTYEALRTALAAPQPEQTHPGYVIGSHWLETAYSRICAGEAEADVLRDYGLVRVTDAEALRRDAERYRWLRDKSFVWDFKMPQRFQPAVLWLHDHGNQGIDAIIDAAMGDKT